jgi:hypothetical protein
MSYLSLLRVTYVAFLLALRTSAVHSVSLVMRYYVKIDEGHFLLHYSRFFIQNYPTVLHLARQLIQHHLKQQSNIMQPELGPVYRRDYRYLPPPRKFPPRRNQEIFVSNYRFHPDHI